MSSYSQAKVKVYITIDTEFDIDFTTPNQSIIADAVQRDIYGRVPQGVLGLPYLLDTFAEHDLKCDFFVEALAPSVIGHNYLVPVIESIWHYRQGIQLHIHTECLAPGNTICDSLYGYSIKDFPLEQQTKIVKLAIDNLRSLGITKISAFRAGNFGANMDTLKALIRNGILIDTSYNQSYLGLECAMTAISPGQQSTQVSGVWVYPVSHFQDGFGHARHLQITACSAAEIKDALMAASDKRWDHLVLVMHSFELIKRRGKYRNNPQLDRINLRRFQSLCRFLKKHRDRFQTESFSDVSWESHADTRKLPALRATKLSTIKRYAEQAIRRL